MKLELSVADIKDLMESVARNRLGGLKLSGDDFSLEIDGEAQLVAAATVSTAACAAPAAAAVAIAAAPEADCAPQKGTVIAPIVGTFYASPAPEKPPFVSVGSRVCKGDVLFIIESMKLMNEVTSEVEGTVTKILVENAQGVEYGQGILCIE